MPSYIDALCQEIHGWGVLLKHPQVVTVFLGGGTPSYLPSAYNKRIIESVRTSFKVAPNASITLEGNPDDLTVGRLTELTKIGITRLSIGVQSLNDSLLKILGRRHTAAQARQAFYNARKVGFHSVNLDLMFGLPHQTIEQWNASVDDVLEMHPEHISMYCLTLEPTTPFYQWVQETKLPDPDPDLAAEMYELAERRLAAAGYLHYEISNWALPGHQSLHNLTYWLNKPYLGVGPGAHSYINKYRLSNINSPSSYIRCIQKWQVNQSSSINEPILRQTGAVDTVEKITVHTEMGETMMMGLRLSQGVSKAQFHDRFGHDILDIYEVPIRNLTGFGLLEWHDNSLCLTPRGRLLGNEVFEQFICPS